MQRRTRVIRGALSASVALAVLVLGQPALPGLVRSAGAATLTQGGTFICQYQATVSGHLQTVTDYQQAMAAGTTGSIVANPTTPNNVTASTAPPKLSESSTCTLTGVIPQGWSVSVAWFPLTLAAHSGNTGTLVVTNPPNTSANPTNVTGSTFENQGTFAIQSTKVGETTPALSANVDVAAFVNLAGGTVSVQSGDHWDFDYDNATAAGTFDNEGAIDDPSGAKLQVSNANCKTGIDFTSAAGSTVDAAGTFSVPCGGIDIQGGTVTGGAIETGGNTLALTFGTAVAAGSTGTIDLSGGGMTLSGVIASGWTVETDAGFDAKSGSGNAGKLEVNGVSGAMTVSGTFTNSGTFTLDKVGLSIDAPDFVNTGTMSVVGTTSASSDVTFDYDNATTAGVFTNQGTLDVVSTHGSVIVGGEACTTGVNLVTSPTSVIDNQGTVDERCGELDLDGGTVTSAGPLTVEPIGHATVDFGPDLVAGTGDGADTVQTQGSGITLEGAIPSGWTIDELGNTLTVATGTSNAGTIDIHGSGLTGTGTFANSGTVDSISGGDIDFPQLTNTGTLESAATSGRSVLDFNYDNATTPGTIDNYGIISTAANQGITVGPQECKTGEDLVEEAGSTIDVNKTGSGTITMSCGELTVDGGSISASGPLTVEPIGHVTVDFASHLPAGGGGSADTIQTQGSGITLEGAIPAGWTLDELGSTLSVATGTSNAGTIDIHGSGLTGTGTFANSGTVDSISGGDIDFPQLTNTGTLESAATSGRSVLDFNYDNATTPGTIDNYGIISTAANQGITVGPQECKTGEDLVEEAGSTIDVNKTGSGTITMSCGELTVDGGSISASGPLTVEPIGHVTVDFASHLPAGGGGSADTIQTQGSGITLEGAIPSGWTIDEVGNTLTVATGTTSAGTIDINGSGLTGTGTFANSGTVDSISGGEIDFPQLANTGTIESGATSGRSVLDFNYDNATTPGTIDNYGTISNAANQGITIGPESCKTGEDLVEEAGSTIDVDTTGDGTITMSCGELTIDGGTIAASGPLIVDPVGHVDITFAADLPVGTSTDILSVYGSDVSLVDSIPAGWTIRDHYGSVMNVPSGGSNDGTLDFVTGGDITNTGTFTNAGTINVTGSTGSSVIRKFINTGTINVSGTATFALVDASFANSGTINLTHGWIATAAFTQNADGTLAETVHDGQNGFLRVDEATTTLSGTLALTTTGKFRRWAPTSQS